MKKITYLTAPVAVLALFASGCSQEAPTAASGNEGAQKIGAPAVSSEEQLDPQLVPEAARDSIGTCCPEGFNFEAGFGDPADRNGDNAVCRKVTPGGATITIDNTASGDCCSPFIPPGCI